MMSRRDPHQASRTNTRQQLRWMSLAVVICMGCSGQAPPPDSSTPTETAASSSPATSTKPPEQARAAAERPQANATQPAKASPPPSGGGLPIAGDRVISSVPLGPQTLPGSDEGLATAPHPPGYVPSLETEGEAGVRTLPGVANGQSIEVFFATDRLPTAALLPSPLRTLAPALIVGMLGCALFIGFSLARRFQAVWLVACSLAVCLGITVFHASIIRLQQYTRLAQNASTRFSAYRDEDLRDYPLHLGTARVSLPPNHQPGRFEQPKLYRFEFTESPEKHIVLHRLDVAESADKWFQEVSQAAQQTASLEPEGFIFIHGYNVHFIDALKRTAQLANDLHLAGPAICYSWPSRGEVAAYTVDEATVSWSAPHFEKLLLDLHAQTRCRRIHVLAHSMGNRALLEALERIDLQRTAPPATANNRQPLIDSLVMAAPDVDRQQFIDRFATPLCNLAARPTLYFSDGDRALQLSAGIHGGPRLGLFGEAFQTLSGIDSIYVGSQASLALGHSYYGDDPAVVDDLRQLLQARKPAADRQRLRRMTGPGGQSYWQIDSSLQAQRPANSPSPR